MSPSRMSVTPILLFLVPAVAGCGPTEDKPQHTEVSSILRVEPAEVDFGEVLQGERLHTTVVLVNTGSATERLAKINPSCGCAAVLTEDRLLGPGESTRLEVNFSTRDLLGPNEKWLEVHLEGRLGPATRIPVRAYVLRGVAVEPAVLDLGNVTLSPASAREATLRRLDGSPLEIASVEIQDPWLHAEIGPRDEDPSRATILVSVDSNAPPGWWMAGNLVVLVKSKHSLEVQIPVRARKESGIVVEPADRLVFRDLRPDTTARQTVRVHAGEHTELPGGIRAALRVHGDDRQGEQPVEVRVIDSGRTFEVLVEVKPAPGRSVLSGTLSLRGAAEHPWSRELLVWGTVRSEAGSDRDRISGE